MTRDIELETWQQEWRSETEPLPELKRKIKRQDRRMIVAALVLGLFLAFSTSAALRTRSSLLFGRAVGAWSSALLLAGYAWWVRRGTWKPSAQTTQAYLELSYNRAVAKAHMLRAGSYVLAVAGVLYMLLVASKWMFHWDAGYSAPKFWLDTVVLLAMGAEVLLFRLLFRRQEQRKKREIEKTKKLLEEMTSS